MTGRTDFRPRIRTTSSTRRSRCATSSGTSGPRSASSSATTCGCCASAPATTRGREFLNIQQIFHDFYYTQFTNLDNDLVESRDAYISLFDWHLRSGDSVHAILDVNPVYERLFEPFEISPGVFLPPGEYRFTRFRSNRSDARRGGGSR